MIVSIPYPNMLVKTGFLRFPARDVGH